MSCILDKFITTTTLPSKLKDRCDFEDNVVSLHRLLLQVGFKWKKKNPQGLDGSYQNRHKTVALSKKLLRT